MNELFIVYRSLTNSLYAKAKCSLPDDLEVGKRDSLLIAGKTECRPTMVSNYEFCDNR